MNSRELFEQWYSSDGQYPAVIERNGEHYKLIQAQQAWTAWQAAGAVERAACVQACDDKADAWDEPAEAYGLRLAATLIRERA